MESRSPTKTLDVASLPEQGAAEVWLDPEDPGTSLIVLRRDGHVHAYRNVCPHAGRFLNWAPGRFLFDSDRLVCAAHGAVFEVRTGLCVDGPCRGSHLIPIAVEDVGDGRVRLKAD